MLIERLVRIVGGLLSVARGHWDYNGAAYVDGLGASSRRMWLGEATLTPKQQPVRVRVTVTR